MRGVVYDDSPMAADRTTDKPLLARTRWYLLALSVPAAVLIGSFLHTPYLSTVAIADGTRFTADAAVIELYRYRRCRFAYTSSDLLAFNAIIATRPAMQAARIDALVFDVYPATDDIRTNSRLTWIALIAAGMERSGDAALAGDFKSQLGSRSHATGEVYTYLIPATSPFARASGLRSIHALAIRSSRAVPVTPAQFSDAIGRAVRDAQRVGARSIGLPYIASPADAHTRSDRTSGWGHLLRVTRTTVCAADGGRILFGGYALSSANRAANLRNLADAWEAERASVAATYETTTLDRLRIAAATLLAALLAGLLAGRPLSIGRFAALLATAGAVGGLVISSLSLWIAPWISDGAKLSWMPLLQLLAGVVAGATLQHWIRFDARKQLAQD
jgi:hypothetical protein